ncbi:MAG TPA: thiol reductant ABC exporter subunit CydC [Ktedonobacteraceae bacterium]|nr:thiol reductant ABC exporter subunit CydC [Ktedonobacteraceae bacterium]
MNSMRIFLRLLSFLAPFRWLVALAILLGSIMIASNMLLLGMAAYLIAASALGPLMVTLTIPVYVVRFMSVSRAGSRYAERLTAHKVTFRLLARLRTWVYRHLEPLSPTYLHTQRSGDILTRLVTDVDELQNVYLRVVSPIVVAILISMLTFALFAIFSTVMAWVAVAFLVVTGCGVPLLSGMLARGMGKQQLAVRAELNAQIVDGIQGVQDLLAFGQENTQLKILTDLEQRLGKIQQRMALINGLQQALNDLLMNLALWSLLILAIPLVLSKAIDGVYLAFLALIILASFEAVQPLGQAFQMLGHSIAAGERLFKITDAMPQVQEPATLLPVPDSTAKGLTLKFDHVHFAYHADEDEVVRDVSFEVLAGKRVAIVGASGAGKSTLMNLILRFWDVTQGTIQLNGQNIQQYALEDLRGLIGVVAQDTYLFNDTIRGNLLLARPEATDSELEQVLEQAQLSEFIHRLPEGLTTWAGEQGLRLSGGERQRLAIARALLKDAPLLILDEATANLDPLTEHTLLDALDMLMKGRTTLFITHHLVGMERMDEILVLNEGRICERGTHDELLRAHGLYYEMVQLQEGMLSLL